MVDRRRGHVINLGSVAGTYPYPGGNAHAGSKAFVHQFSLTVRLSGDRAKADAVYTGMQPLTADDIAELKPVAQSFGPFQVARDG